MAMPRSKMSFVPSVNVTLDPTDAGFACTISEDKQESEDNEQYYMCCTIARGMVQLAIEQPEYVFTQGIRYMEEEAKEEQQKKQNVGKVIDIKEFFKSLKKGLH